ncbi:unnamed protein product [Cladocopium goreaui]|uniref:NmrA-like family domain-containing protein 1 n=1 Tax=Cladocopium goreaui TaxID=2562237 RepID=A0A9P1DU10_9DINO|nr:unnamed protein product [Cladocopium goreaui]
MALRYLALFLLLRLLGAEERWDPLYGWIYVPHARNVGKELDSFIEPGNCKGPVLVLFVKNDAIRAAVLRSFEDAAQEIAGLACLGIVHCDDQPAVCAKQNVRKTPSVMLYPTGNRAARLYRGRLSEEGFTAAVAQMIGFNDRTVHLTHRSLSEFLTGRTRPIKVLLFSRRPRTPVIFKDPKEPRGSTFPKALSSDAELWPHMEFGFIPEEVDNARNPLLDAYNIETVPQVTVQYGPDLSTKQTYASTDITYPALKEWLLARRAEFWLGSPLWQETTPEEPEALLDDTPDSNYEVLAPGTKGCPTDLEIKSVSECQTALKELGMDVDPRWVSNYPELPSKCSVRESPSAEHPERMHFNSFVGGAGRQDLSPVCKRPGAATSASSAAASAASTLSAAMRGAEVQEIDISSLPQQLQNMLQNLDLNSAAEIDLDDLMRKLAGNLATKSKPRAEVKVNAEPKATSTAAKQQYVKLPVGANGCPMGSEILTFDECRQAILSLGLKPDPYWTSSYEGLPRHCSLRERPGEGIGLERMHFNTANRGSGRDDLAPICRKGQTPSIEATSSKSKSQQRQPEKKKGSVASETSPVIQELNIMSQQRLLNRDKFYYLVYMTKGGLTNADESMLLDVKDHFQQRLDERGVLMDFLWLDLSIERQLKILLDPPALPSAMVLRGGGQPKFVLAHHREEDEEAVGVKEEDIILLVNKVLGDEARFQRLNAKKLEMAWTKRGPGG